MPWQSIPGLGEGTVRCTWWIGDDRLFSAGLNGRIVEWDLFTLQPKVSFFFDLTLLINMCHMFFYSALWIRMAELFGASHCLLIVICSHVHARMALSDCLLFLSKRTSRSNTFFPHLPATVLLCLRECNLINLLLFVVCLQDE